MIRHSWQTRTLTKSPVCSMHVQVVGDYLAINHMFEPYLSRCIEGMDRIMKVLSFLVSHEKTMLCQGSFYCSFTFPSISKLDNRYLGGISCLLSERLGMKKTGNKTKRKSGSEMHHQSPTGIKPVQ